MMPERFEGASPWHPLGCRCSRCVEPGPATPRLDAAQIAAVVALLGFVTGVVLVEIIAAATGAPGIELIFQ